jgi:hypothetical protein
MRSFTLSILVLATVLTAPVWAGGAWVPKPGDGSLRLGASRKKAQFSWGVDGRAPQPGTTLRYALERRDGALEGLAANWTLPPRRLRGRSRLAGAEHRLLGRLVRAEVRTRQDSAAVAVGPHLRTPFLYDQEGPYNRHTFNADGSFRVNSEWRGLLCFDYTLSLHGSHSLWEGGWASVETGYTGEENSRRPAPLCRRRPAAALVRAADQGHRASVELNDSRADRTTFQAAAAPTSTTPAWRGSGLCWCRSTVRSWYRAGYNQ